MAKPTVDEIVDKQEVRRDLFKEARRLSRLPQIRTYLDIDCEIESYNQAANLSEERVPSFRYKFKGRDQRRALNELRQLVRDNILPAFRNGKSSRTWSDLNEKVNALTDLLLAVSVSEDRRPWLPVKPAKPPRGNQGQGQGNGPGN